MDPFLETNPIFQELHTQMLAETQALRCIAVTMGLQCNPMAAP
jgi:hypothetical protein